MLFCTTFHNYLYLCTGENYLKKDLNLNSLNKLFPIDLIPFKGKY